VTIKGRVSGNVLEGFPKRSNSSDWARARLGDKKVGKYYQELDRVGGFDYELHQVPGLGTRYYRGPPVDTSKPFLAFVGAAQTFGRFASAPFPALLGRRLGVPVLNLGVGGAGPRHFNEPRYLSLLNRAEAVVIQTLSGRSSSNSLFDNSALGSSRGQTSFASEPLRAEEFFARAAKAYSLETLERIVAETRYDYTGQFIDFINKISRPRILLWLSTRAPAYQEDYEHPPDGILGAFPQLVNKGMVAEIAAFCDDYVECISTAGLPQTLWRGHQSIEGALSNNGVLENRYYPSPAMHYAAAGALEGTCRRFLGRPVPASGREPASRFVIVAAARTGTNLLRSLLKHHEGCLCGNELFNPTEIANKSIPWPEIPDAQRTRLLALRQADPVAFWDELCVASLSRGYRAVGFKLLYSQGLSQKPLLDRLTADRTIRIIHLTRRNLLRRLLSERQAYATNQWAIGRGSPPNTRPQVTITIGDIMKSIDTVEAHQAAYDLMFKDHPVLRFVFEDFVERPQHVAARAAEFLGLPPFSGSMTIMFQKTGTDDLAQALIGFDDLRAQVRRWSSFFEG
jgi:LPS sulfotransferase NodH